jgi:ABC-type transporter Mla subunit MlaD
MRDRGIEFKVGLLVLTGLVVFAGFIFVLGNFSLSSGYTIYVDYEFSGIERKHSVGHRCTQLLCAH